MTTKYFYHRGRRKSAHARVKLYKGKGSIKINDSVVDNNRNYNDLIKLVGQENKWDIVGFVKGGGFSSQIDAVSLAIARTLVLADSSLKTTLKKAGYLTRDSREKERKKYGLKKARKAPQWSKR